MKRRLWGFVALALAITAICGCGAQKGLYRGLFYTLRMSDVWEHKDYTGELLKSTGTVAYALFSKAPIQIEQWYDEDNLEYGLVCAAYFDSKVSLGDFRSVGTLPLNQFVKELYNSTEYVSGQKARLAEYEIKEKTYNIMFTIPLSKGYLEIRGWSPVGNKELIEEYRQIARTLSIDDVDYFVKHPQSEEWRQK